MEIRYETLNHLADIIEADFSDKLGDNFYSNALLNIRNEVHFEFSGIYFLDDICFSLGVSFCLNMVSIPKP